MYLVSAIDYVYVFFVHYLHPRFQPLDVVHIFTKLLVNFPTVACKLASLTNSLAKHKEGEVVGKVCAPASPQDGAFSSSSIILGGSQDRRDEHWVQDAGRDGLGGRRAHRAVGRFRSAAYRDHEEDEARARSDDVASYIHVQYSCCASGVERTVSVLFPWIRGAGMDVSHVAPYT